MATITYEEISSAATTTLLAKDGSDSGGFPLSGELDQIVIVNHHDSDSNTIKLYLDDGGAGDDPTLLETVIPSRASLVLDHNIYFDINTYSLKLTTSSAANLTVIIYTI